MAVAVAVAVAVAETVVVAVIVAMVVLVVVLVVVDESPPVLVIPMKMLLFALLSIDVDPTFRSLLSATATAAVVLFVC